MNYFLLWGVGLGDELSGNRICWGTWRKSTLLQRTSRWERLPRWWRPNICLTRWATRAPRCQARSCSVIGVSYFRVKICVRTHSLQFGKRSRSGLVFLGRLMLLDESRKPFPGVQLCEDNLAWRISRVAHNIIQKSIESVIRRMFLQIKLLSICKWFRNSLLGNGVRLLSSGCIWFWWTLGSWISLAPKMWIVMSFLSHDSSRDPRYYM